MIRIVEVFREIVAATSDLYLERNENARKIHFYADNFVNINGELLIRGQTTEGAKNKYPAILLFCDNGTPVKETGMKVWDAETTLNFLIVDDAIPQGNAELQREKSVYPVLCPIYDCFLESIRNSPRIFTKERTLEPEYGIFCNIGGTQSMFGDFLNGIEIKNLKLKIKEESCF